MKAEQNGMNGDYARVEAAIRYLEVHYQEQPSLDELAARVHLSKFHFQRMFSRWAGISPKRFMQVLTLGHAKALLAESRSVLDAALDSGLSGPARLHDLFVAVDAATPGEFKRLGEGMTIRYGWHSTPFGECLLSLTERGVCGLSFTQPERRAALEDLHGHWPRANLTEDAQATAATARRIFSAEGGGRQSPLALHLFGTNFQVNVWQALLNIPPGALASYQDIARLIGKPEAARAVGGAVGGNPIAYLIPCHRVIRKSGEIGAYRWGTARKKAMLAWETAHGARLAG
ncbi:MAG: methylated-DNA--[protein]-cysteine S-methyltransferase [SAR324 cluster bacterium]|nr:methylated-DNA--[protein]-cysteine S-methyltransferase [SAR324 cluster bacterium]